MYPAGLLDADDSGSMVFEERGERIDDLKVASSTCCCSNCRVLQGFLGLTTSFCADVGVTLRWPCRQQRSRSYQACCSSGRRETWC